MVRKRKKTGDNLPAEMDQNTASELVKSVCYDKGGSRQIEFILYVLSGKSIADAAGEAGFSLNHGYRLMRKYREDAKFRQRVAEVSAYFPEWYISTTKLKAPRLADLDNKVLDKYEQDVELAIRHPQALKQIKQTAGLLPSDTPQVIREVVNIERIQAFVQNVLESPDDVIDIKQIIQDDGTEPE